MRTRMLVAMLLAGALTGPAAASGATAGPTDAGPWDAGAARRDPVLDVSFGVDGVATGYQGGFGNNIVDMVVQPDGRTVAVGAGVGPSTSNMEFHIARYLPDGSLDTSFGADGGLIVYASPDGSGSMSYAVAVRPDGRILVAGSVSRSSGWMTAAVLSLLPDGTPDGSFGTGGRSLLTIDGSTSSRVADMILSPDGTALLALDGVGLARLRPDGALDPTFGDGGVARSPVTPGRYDFTTTMAVAPDGGILVAGAVGWWGSLPELSTDVLVTRFRPDGAVDTSFGVGGRVTRDLSGPAGTDGVDGMAVARDGRVVLTVGLRDFPPGEWERTRAGLLRYLPDGRPDPSFGRRGFAPTDVPARSWTLTSPIIRPDGRILTVGGTHDVDAADLLFAQFRPDGRPDPTFGRRGVLLPAVPGDRTQGAMLRIRPDGRLVVGGSTGTDNGANSFAVFQFLP